MRIEPDGPLDESFGVHGQVPFGDTNCNYVDFAISSDNKILLDRSCSSGQRSFGQINKLWPDGTPYLRFGQGGKLDFERPDERLFMGHITISEDGRITITGLRQTYTHMPFTAKFFGSGKTLDSSNRIAPAKVVRRPINAFPTH